MIAHDAAHLRLFTYGGHDGTPLLVPHFGVPYFKKMKVGYIASVLTDEFFMTTMTTKMVVSCA